MTCRVELGVFSHTSSRLVFLLCQGSLKNGVQGRESRRERHHGEEVQVYSAQRGHLNYAKSRKETAWTGISGHSPLAWVWAAPALGKRALPSSRREAQEEAWLVLPPSPSRRMVFPLTGPRQGPVASSFSARLREK